MTTVLPLSMEDRMGFLGSILHFMKEAEWGGVVILIVAVMASAIGVERWLRIQFQYSINSRAFMAKLKKYILSDNIDRAISLCNSKPNALLPRVLKAGLTRAKDTPEDIQNAVDEATLEVLPKLEARALYLPTLANISTLVGLLATVLGLVMAFDASGEQVDAVTRQSYLQKAIALAMHTTVLGLAVAIPSMLVHTVLSSKINAIISDIDQYSVKLINLLSAAQKSGTKGSSHRDEEAAND